MALAPDLADKRQVSLQSFWLGGMNSNMAPLLLPRTVYQCAFNMICRGGIISVRPRYTLLAGVPGPNPQGICLFTPTGAEDPALVTINAGVVYASYWPYTSVAPVSSIAVSGATNATPIAITTTAAHGYSSGITVNISGVLGNTAANGTWIVTVTGANTFTLNGSVGSGAYTSGGLAAKASLSPLAPQVFSCVVTKAVKQETSGALTIIPPVSLLILSDGQSRTLRWDGVRPPTIMDPQPPYFGVPGEATSMVFSNGRLWVAQGPRVYASDLDDPDTFAETLVIAEGGFLAFPSDVTCMIETPDRSGIIIFTDYSAYFIKSSLRIRTQWQIDPSFFQTLLTGLGCAGGKAAVNQFGLTWFFTPGGLISLDTAQQTYQTSNVLYQDLQMKRSKDNLSADCSRVCLTSHEDYLLCSVPSGDVKNRHTWCLDENAGNGRAWASIWKGTRPVEYATAVIKGKLRTFYLSADYGGTANIWEAFGTNQEEPSGQVTASMETGLFPIGPLEPAAFASLELFLVGVEGLLGLQVFVGANAGGYLRILNTTVNAERGPYDDTVFTCTEDSVLDSYRPQTRILRTNAFDSRAALLEYPDAAVSNRQENGDTQPLANGRFFSFIIQLSGVGAIQSLRVTQDAKPTQTDPKCSPDETEDTTSPLLASDYRQEFRYHSL